MGGVWRLELLGPVSARAVDMLQFRTEVNNHRSDTTREQRHETPPLTKTDTDGQGCHSVPRTQIWSLSCALAKHCSHLTQTQRGENKTKKKLKKQKHALFAFQGHSLYFCGMHVSNVELHTSRVALCIQTLLASLASIKK